MPLDVICVGAVTVDTITTIDRLPAEDGRVVGEPFTVAGGGPAATAAVALARLGARVGFCGVVGDDDAGRLSRALLEEEGVDTTWLRVRPGIRTPQSMIMVSRGSGARTIVTSPATPPDDVPRGAARWLHADHNGYAAARAALDGRTSLSIDGGNPIPGLDLAGVELYAPTATSLRAAFPAPAPGPATDRAPGSATDHAADHAADPGADPGADRATDPPAGLEASLRAAAAAGARQVVATSGGDGCYVLVADELTHVPAVPVEPVSTMGAGDVFHGALLAGLVEGRPLVEAARRANLVAALSCRSLDGRSGIPRTTEVEHWLSTARPAPRSD
ncbi:carbohydrate kinase family protein [Nonomuraea jiangxiensis]|uniref:Sulfofructose kinase n=1 Tax=Nonomuraea jiangxiensis TaxID=633440 RepID=A0A1G9FCC0_9ACTN|nr:PfkB family carbohydrate kinase [Nonomuraea jiangxiensis]SDK85988.1 sulfofructose kinase [Nonomuraea jiangxiensis]